MPLRRRGAAEPDLSPGLWVGIIIRADITHEELEEDDCRKTRPGFAGWRSFGDLAHQFLLICAGKIDEVSIEQASRSFIEPLQAQMIGLAILWHVLIAVP